MSRLFNLHLQQTIERVLNEYDVPGYILRLDTLDLDLGELLVEQLDNKLPKLFEDALRKALRDKLGPPSRKPPVTPQKNVQVLALFPARLEMLQRYLVSGHVTTGYKVRNKSIEEVFHELVSEDEAAVKAMLLEAVRVNKSSIERIAFQFHSRSMDLIFKMFAPAFRSFLAAQESMLLGLITSKVTQQHGAAQRSVRKAILSYLISPSRPAFEVSEFRQKVTSELKKDLGEAVNEALVDSVEFAAIVEPDKAPADRKMEESVNILMAFLQDSTFPQDRMLLVQAWEHLSLEAPKRLATLIRRAKPTVKQVLSLLDVLPEVALTDYLERVLPSHSEALSMILAEVVAVFQAYAHPKAGLRDMRNQTLAELVLYASEIAAKPQQFSPRVAVKQIEKSLKSRPDVPQELKKALERNDLPGISDLLRNDLDLPGTESGGEQPEVSTTEEERAKFIELKEKFLAEQEQLTDLTDESSQDPEIKKRRAEREQLLEQDEAFAQELEAQQEIESEVDGEKRKPDAEEDVRERPEDLPKSEGKEPSEPSTEMSPPEEDEEKHPPRKPHQRATEIPVSEKDDVARYLDTVAGRVAYLTYFIRHGEEPWWAGPKDPTRVELYFSALMKLAPAGLKDVFLELVAEQGAERLDAPVARLHKLVGGRLLIAFINHILPEIGGLSFLIREVLETYLQNPPSGFSLPGFATTARDLVLHHVFKFALVYQSSAPNAQMMVRYLVRELGLSTSQPSRTIIKDLTAILDERIGKGERKFVALKMLLPMSFMDITVEPPLPVVSPPPAIQFVSAARADEILIEWQAEFSGVDQVAVEKLTVDEVEGIDENGDVQVSPTEEGPKKQFEKDQDIVSISEEEGVSETLILDGNEPVIPDFFIETIEDERDALSGEEKDDKELLRDAFRFEEETPGLERGGAEPEVVGEEQEAEDAEAQRRQLSEFLEEAIKAKLPFALRFVAETEEGVKIVKHFLETGTLPGNYPVSVSKQAFLEMLEYLLIQHKTAMVAMLKRVLMDRSVRLRVVKELPGMHVKMIRTLAPNVADTMLPYTEAIADLASSTSSPIAKDEVLEHAIAYSVKVRGEIFSPLDYVRSLIQYALNQLSIEPRSLVSFLETRLEQRQVPQKFAIQQVLQTVRSTSTPPKPADPEKDKKTPAKFRPLDEDFFVANAGIVLIWPFFGQLFSFLKLLSPDKKSFLDDEKQAKAAHLIQYLLNGEINAPEENLTLNKVLVGMQPEDPLMEIDELTQEEIDLVSEMLGVAAERSGLVKGPHGEALRDTFMDREGRLKKEKDGWSLKVQAKAYDMLLGRLQWGLNPVRLPWLKVKFQIDWK